MNIGVIGLGVMGENLIRNLLDKKYTVSIYNRTIEKTHVFLNELNKVDRLKSVGFDNFNEFINSLGDQNKKKPKIILLMVKAGNPVDMFLQKLESLIDANDIVIDGGNSNYHDTVRRCVKYTGKFLYVGCGISGGEEGARYGPSIMPGGHDKAWPEISSILQDIAAKNDSTRKPCCEWIGLAGSGHLVKMVHNGIEYAEMQILGDFYQMFRKEKCPKDISKIFKGWTKNGTSGFLIEALQDILKKKIKSKQEKARNGSGFSKEGKIEPDNIETDSSSKLVSNKSSNCGTLCNSCNGNGRATVEYLIDSIVDVSEQKGTGKWTALESLFMDVPMPVIVESVNARIASSMKKERVFLAKTLPIGKPDDSTCCGKKASIFDIITEDEMRRGFLLCRALSYIQGFNLIKKVSDVNSWNISLSALCAVWSNGCIIRSEFLETLAEISKNTPFFYSADFIEIAQEGITPLRKMVGYCTGKGISIPCMVSSLSYYDGIRTEESSGNIIQALRDYFGAHTLLLKGETEKVHINWK